MCPSCHAVYVSFTATVVTFLGSHVKIFFVFRQFLSPFCCAVNVLGPGARVYHRALHSWTYWYLYLYITQGHADLIIYCSGGYISCLLATSLSSLCSPLLLFGLLNSQLFCYFVCLLSVQYRRFDRCREHHWYTSCAV